MKKIARRNGKVNPILDAISDEMSMPKRNKILEEELDNVKIRYKRGFLITFEPDFSIAGYLSSTEPLTGNLETVHHTIERINWISSSQLITLAWNYFHSVNQCMVLIGKTLLIVKS